MDINFEGIKPDLNQSHFEKVPVRIFKSTGEASITVAKEVAALIKEKNERGKNCVLGLPTGSTPIGVYDELVRLHKEEGLSFRNVVTFNTDEYYPIDPTKLQSFSRYMQEYLFDHIDIKEENIHIPDGMIPPEEVNEYCQDFEKKIIDNGGIDLQLLGIGRTGHIGFNEPGSGKDSKTRLISLDHVTRAASASDFFGEENVPRRAITMGVGTFLEAKRIILMAWGEGKANVIKEMVEGPKTDALPASYIQDHPHALVVLGSASSSELTRINTPWLVEIVKWDERLIRKAVVWLCQKVDKPILKLTNRDYNDNGMSDLAAEYGSAYQINLKIFNALQHTITGWPGGKPDADDSQRPERAVPFPKRVVIFSPHPDDDIISMGGTFIRLVDHGNDVHVAYQTSGNIAVFDDDVIRFADFMADYQSNYATEYKQFKELFLRVREFIKNKKPGQVDSDEVRQVKGLIRRGEAKDVCRFVGIPDDHVHFLNMPFYETGTVKKKPIGEEDVQMIMDLLLALIPTTHIKPMF